MIFTAPATLGYLDEVVFVCGAKSSLHLVTVRF